ncbi:MAG: hypothetical protein QM541_09400 [Flavobacterium sp.]|nr:hypothetical protein [Flavobacterium sp.]
MKQLFLMVFGTISVLFVDAQSQTISGTLLPKKGESATYLPKATEAQKPGASKQTVQQDSTAKKAVANTVIQTANQKPIVKTILAAAQQPITTMQPQTVTNNTEATKKTENEPLKYEEPPTGFASLAAPPNNTAPAKLEPFVYGPPPVANATTAPPTNTSNKKANLRSPNFKGEYKPVLKKPILLVPMLPDDMEDGVPKKKETEPTTNVVEKPKSVEDLYPPLNYTVPTPASASHLRSPKIKGAYVASKNNSIILMPVPPEPTNGQRQSSSTLVYQEPPVQTYNNANAASSTTEPSAASQPNIFDENYRGKPTVTSKTIYTKYKKTAPKTAATKPASTLVKQPVKNNFKKAFLKPVRQPVNGSVSFNHQLFKSKITTSLQPAIC